MSKAPTRLSEGKDELASSIASLRAAVPSEASLAALAERLASAGAPVGNGDAPVGNGDAPVGNGDAPVSTRVPKPERTALTRLKGALDSGVLAVVLALVVGASVVTAAFFLRSAPGVAPVTPPQMSAPSATETDRDAPAVPAAPPAAVSPSDDSHAGAEHARTAHPLPAGSADTPNGAAIAPSTSPTAATAPNDIAIAPNISPAPAPPLSRPLNGPAKSSAPSSRPSTSHAPDTAPGTTEAPLTAGAPIPSEVELLKQARSALSADPLQAFALTEQCRSRYPDGSFAQEREYIAIVALARLGRVDEARSRASLFRMHYKNSAYLPRLGALLGEP